MIDYFFDFMSPYSYLSWNWVKKHALKHNINFIPVNMAQVIKQYETKGPAEIDPKRNYLFRHCLRTAAEAGIAFKPPKRLPFNNLYALRSAVFAIEIGKELEVIDAVFDRGWGQGGDIGTSEALVSLFNEKGLNGQEIVDMATDKNIRRQLKNNVKMAIEKGVFGVPTFVFQNELYWGNDSIQHLEQSLLGKDPLNKNLAQWFENSYPLL